MCGWSCCRRLTWWRVSQNKHVDGFCVGAPWNSVAVDLGIGHILHFMSEHSAARSGESARRARAVGGRKSGRGVAAHSRPQEAPPISSKTEGNRDEVCRILEAPNRIGVPADVIRRTLDGKLKVAPDGTVRTSDRYLMVGRNGAARPDPVQAAWLYAQMVRWGQAPLATDLLAIAKEVFGPTLYDAAIGAPAPLPATANRATASAPSPGRHSTPNDIVGHLSRLA